jgi:hypothetical protein
MRPQSARFFTFPLPVLREFRERYEREVYADVTKGDVLLVDAPPDFQELKRLQAMPCGHFTPPDPKLWEFVARHQRKPPWNWDISAYRRK